MDFAGHFRDFRFRAFPVRIGPVLVDGKDAAAIGGRRRIMFDDGAEFIVCFPEASER